MIDQIQKIAEEIFNELGSGFDESVYQKAFEVALRLKKVRYENQKIVPIFYKEHNIGEGKPDLVIDDSGKKIIVELKATSGAPSPKEETQVRKYMKMLGLDMGVIVNFPQPGKDGVPDKPDVVVVS